MDNFIKIENKNSTIILDGDEYEVEWKEVIEAIDSFNDLSKVYAEVYIDGICQFRSRPLNYDEAWDVEENLTALRKAVRHMYD